jgi:hydroxymethylpyrimidine pyrophosphatase-like HAD family hydrolase
MMTPEGAVISSVKCDGEILKDFLPFAFELGCCGAWIETEHPCRIYPDAKDCVNEHDYTVENMPHFESFNQISVRLADFETASEVSKRIKEKFGDNLNPLQNDVIIDIVSAGVDKAQGLYILMKHLGAKYEDVIAVGDNVNDADMLREFKSYAMANGVDMIKELADGITVGITELIEKEMN